LHAEANKFGSVSVVSEKQSGRSVKRGNYDQRRKGGGNGQRKGRKKKKEGAPTLKKGRERT